MEIREVKIEEYWPLIVKNTEEFGQIAVAENPEFNKLAGCIYQVLQDSFVRDATEYSVGRWENMLDLTPENGDTLDDRKARILTCLNIKLPYTVRVLRQMLIGLLGEDNFTMNINNDTATLTVAVSLDTTESQIAEVESLLDHVLPRNLVTEMEWADGLPIDYTHVEYLENINGGDNRDWEGPAASIRTDIYPTQNTRGKLVAEAVSTESNATYFAFGASGGVNQNTDFGVPWFNRRKKNECKFFINKISTNDYYTMTDGVAHTLEFSKESFKIDGVVKYRVGDIGEFKSPYKLMFLSETPNNVNVRCFRGKAYSFKLWENDVPILDFVPALDPTGAPCFFDTVTKNPYYSVAKGDFTYPGKETEATTYSLRNRMYAQMTEHGVRRLYRVPAGYNGGKEEYAAENGFKVLVENPMPEEGYWTPEWRETDTQLILDWIETEAPIEVTEND